ncbi:ArsR/SmtB family transcription factor [Longispora albida]|uniref:ArsR/SmtB family transcription factor n=1 Tax=Longispora albida TaxID=203523 RepID=UPI00035CD8D2|nr:winged helix-turn-helix domain-containing protein [Longispora albida]
MTAPQLADLAALLADSTRAAFCLALMDGRAWTAGELARHAGVARSTASEHLDRLLTGGLLAEERQGRHRYVRLASPAVATLIEDLAAHAAPPPRPSGLKAAAKASAESEARTCYDHLAGRLGVQITEALSEAGLLADEPIRAWLTTLGADLRPGRRPLVRMCLDWTERRNHLAGTAGAALCTHVLAQGWAERIGTGRAVRLTPAGERALRQALPTLT